MATVVYTDGACSGNPGPGGWAWAVPDGAFASGFAAHTTNQRMEVSAAFEAAKALPGQLEIVSDSTYVINCFQKRWWEGWLARGWTNSAKKPVANRDLWEPFIEHVRSRGNEITFRWVKGHSGDRMNDLVDGLAVEAGKRQAARSGDKPPTGTLPADDAGRSTSQAKPGAKSNTLETASAKASIAAEAPNGHLLLVTGHKPPQLGGYDANPIAKGVKRKLQEIIEAKAKLQPDLVVVSGLGLGAEQLGAEAALEVGVSVAAVLPFPGQEDVWPAASKARYQAILDRVDHEILLEAVKPDSKQAAGQALGRRDTWLFRTVQEALVVWDEQDTNLERTVRSLRDHLGETEVWTIPPG